nr:helix-turn-helix domain-containing protein [uncultured Dyadobacter sp.]
MSVMKSKNIRKILIFSGSMEPDDFGTEALRKNFHVLTSNRGSHAVALTRQMSPDLIICEIADPKVDGLAICAALKSDVVTSHISVILLGPREQEVDGLQAGADTYILHPGNSDVLGLKIENLIRMRETLQELYLREAFDKTESNQLGGWFIEKLRQQVVENISDPNFGVHEIAFQIGISVSVLYRKIRMLKGITVNEFVKAIRMERAMQLLESGTYPVNAVAAAVGYEDVKYFSKEFRKFFEITPIEVKCRKLR